MAQGPFNITSRSAKCAQSQTKFAWCAHRYGFAFAPSRVRRTDVMSRAPGRCSRAKRKRLARVRGIPARPCASTAPRGEDVPAHPPFSCAERLKQKRFALAALACSAQNAPLGDSSLKTRCRLRLSRCNCRTRQGKCAPVTTGVRRGHLLHRSSQFTQARHE